MNPEETRTQKKPWTKNETLKKPEPKRNRKPKWNPKETRTQKKP
jgi:hypothetical protein